MNFLYQYRPDYKDLLTKFENIPGSIRDDNVPRLQTLLAYVRPGNDEDMSFFLENFEYTYSDVDETTKARKLDAAFRTLHGKAHLVPKFGHKFNYERLKNFILSNFNKNNYSNQNSGGKRKKKKQKNKRDCKRDQKFYENISTPTEDPFMQEMMDSLYYMGTDRKVEEDYDELLDDFLERATKIKDSQDMRLFLDSFDMQFSCDLSEKVR